MSYIPGFVGKIPSQGDFISRRLPWEFIEFWDSWLQDGITAAKQQLGNAWLTRYMVGPVWRFMLSPGIHGNQGWIGLWFPSVDRVGRHFPFTVTAQVPGDIAQPGLLFAAESWLADLEDRALQALNPSVSVDHIEAMLASLVLNSSIAEEMVGRYTASPSNAHQSGVAYRLDESIPVASLARITSGIPSQRGASAFWHTWGTEDIAATFIETSGLPAPSTFPAFLTGDWNACGVQWLQLDAGPQPG